MHPVASIVAPRDSTKKSEGLRDRTEESLFELIRRRSIPGARGFLYSADDAELANSIFDGYSIPTILNSLIKRRLALALPILELDEGKLSAHFSLFVRSGASEVLSYLYSDTVKSNAMTVARWIDAIENLPERLETELLHEAAPETGPAAGVSEILQPALLRPLQLLRNANSPIRPLRETALHSQKEVLKLLIREGRLIPVNERVYFPLIPGKIRACYEACNVFIETKLIPGMQAGDAFDAVLKRRLERLKKAESRYYESPTHTPTARFIKRRAVILRRHLSRNESKRGLPLAIQIVESLAAHAETIYRRAAEAIDQNTVVEFRNGLSNHRGNWKNMYRCVGPAERKQMRPRAWSDLRSHPELFSIRYERPGSTQYIFVPKIKGILSELIGGVAKLKSRDRWQITALEELIRTHQDFWAEEFDDPNFQKQFHRATRIAYRNYLPWYVRALLLLRIGSIEELCVSRARERLQSSQSRLARENASRPTGNQSRFRPTPRKFRRRARTIDRALEHFYYTEERVPSILEVAERSSMPDLHAFRQVLEKSHFRILITEEFAESALFFRKDADYAERVRNIRPIVARLAAQLPNESDGDAPECARIRRLQVYLGATPALIQKAATVDEKIEAASRRVKNLRPG